MQSYIYTCSNGRGPEMIERLLKKTKKKKQKKFLGQIINTKKIILFYKLNELCIICLGKTQISQGCMIPCHGFNFPKPDL